MSISTREVMFNSDQPDTGDTDLGDVRAKGHTRSKREGTHEE
jgi:hypothetical protein